ncbi:MAG: hypothetical protein A2096_06200 [Spirochaetes bacterium GWF1_41_5]|nr:MAG: hypothetical protein A2096_06200 [Spirochaetes bacterium GWF1_41_5]HBE04451.1 aldolase [Spirochaetia bacterium]
MNFRKSRILKKIRNNGIAFSTKLNTCSVVLAEIAAMSGFDCIWICREHVPADWKDIEGVIKSAKLYDTDTIVRVSKGSYSDMIKPLEADAAAIMVPHVMSKSEAEKIVYYTKFHPLGRRPIDGGNADGKYTMLETGEYILNANNERITCIQIEDVEGITELDQICEIKGIDMIFFGPADFSQSIGKPGDLNCAEIITIRKKIAQSARKAGKIAGTVGSIDNFSELADLGYNFINIGSDVRYYGKSLATVMEKIFKYNI